jgi:sulfatase modifying factor 1
VRFHIATCCAVGFTVVVSTSPARGQGAPPNYDFNWAMIDHPSNAAYPGDADGRMAGRGSVSYAYRISQLEITTSQWMEFVNTFTTQSNEYQQFALPTFWGASFDFSYKGPGRRYVLNSYYPEAARLPVGGISWRDAAMYCNWLTNGKGSSPSSLASGAYDASTFHTNPDGTYTDQRTHSPTAQFWMPTLDEWIKAAHYDPNRYGSGQPGWWTYSISSDTAPVPGVPGVGQTNTGFRLDNFGEWRIPVGSYPSVRSPWGLLDTSGGAGEWTEEVYSDADPTDRGWDGSYTGSGVYLAELDDQVSRLSGGSPWNGDSVIGLRVVSAVPAPGGALVLAAVFARCRSRATGDHRT